MINKPQSKFRIHVIFKKENNLQYVWEFCTGLMDSDLATEKNNHTAVIWFSSFFDWCKKLLFTTPFPAEL